MKKTFKRIVSLCLCAVLMLGLGTIALADGGKTVYTDLGDSIPAGYGLYDYGKDNSVRFAMTRTIGSYPDLVADTLGYELNDVACCGFRTVEARVLLDSSYSGDGAIMEHVIETLSGLGTMEAFYAKADAYVEAVKDADVLTINFGSNDTMTYAIVRLSVYLSSHTTDKATLAAIDSAQIYGLDSLISVYEKLMTIAKTMGVYAGALAEMSDAMYDGYNMFKENWDAILKIIYALNPDVTVLAIGMYNPFRDLKLTDYSLLHIGRLADQFVGLMNLYIKDLSGYSDVYTFVDVSDAEVWDVPALTDDEFSDNFIRNVHPTAEGHKYIAGQIVSAIKKLADASDEDSGFSVLGAMKNFLTSVVTGFGFTDVSSGAWYSSVVEQAAKLGIMNGISGTTFDPTGNVTRAQAVKMAAVTHSTYFADGYVFDMSEGAHWYDTYVSYAAANGIISAGEFASYDVEATRAEVAGIFANALPECELAAVVSNESENIADVNGAGEYDAEILTLYRAGVIGGRGNGAFDGSASITRAECAAIISRLCLTDSRLG